MNHRGLRARLTGAGCTPCAAAVPMHRIAVLVGRVPGIRTVHRGAGSHRAGASASAT